MAKILVCIDGSVYADNLCTHAAWVAKNINAEIDLLHGEKLEHGLDGSIEGALLEFVVVGAEALLLPQAPGQALGGQSPFLAVRRQSVQKCVGRCVVGLARCTHHT